MQMETRGFLRIICLFVLFVSYFLSFFLSLGLVGFSSFRTKGLLMFSFGTAAKPNQSPTESL